MDKTKNCPYCGEEIMADARKCKHCGEWLEEEPIQEQTQEGEKSETDAPVRHNAVPEQIAPDSHIKREDPSCRKSKKWLLAVIPIVVAIVGVGLYLFCVFGNEPIIKGLLSKSENSEVGLKQSEDRIKTEIEKQVLDAYINGTIYDLMTPDFNEKTTKAFETGLCIDPDFCYGYNYTSISSVHTDLTGDGNTLVHLNLIYDESDAGGLPNQYADIVLVMVKVGSKWFVDDVVEAGYSAKEAMVDCINEDLEHGDYIDDYYDYEDEVENESALDLEHVTYQDYYNPRFDFSVSYPSFFQRKYEAYNQDGCEFWFGNNYSMKAYGMYNVLEKTIKELFEDSKSSKDTYSTCKDNWFVVSGINEQGNIYYRKTMLANDVEYTVELVYPQDKKEQYNAVVQKVMKSIQVQMVEEDSVGRLVVIDGSELRLRLGPSTNSETLKWGDGSNRHPNVGEKFKYLDESTDFYKIDYKGNEVWVSKQYTHTEIQ